MATSNQVRRVSLLLTATIDPGSTAGVARADPKLRLADYQASLVKWIKAEGFHALVFCDNSAVETSSIVEVAASHERLEIVSFDGNYSALARGKGAGELDIIRHAFRQSPALSSSDMVLKVTGRLYVRNYLALLRALKTAPADTVHVNLGEYAQWADSRCFAAAPSFYTCHLLNPPIQPDDSTGMYLEHVMARSVHMAIAKGAQWRPWPCAVRYLGHSGSSGLAYTDHVLNRAKRAMFARARDALMARR